jgi:hypothetical protein
MKETSTLTDEHKMITPAVVRMRIATRKNDRRGTQSNQPEKILPSTLHLLPHLCGIRIANLLSECSPVDLSVVARGAWAEARFATAGAYHDV